MKEKLDSLVQLYKTKNFSELVNKGQEFVDEHTNSAIAWNLLALGHRYSGNIEEAKKIYESLLKLNPKNFLLNTNLGNLYTSIGKINNAIECFENALSIQPDHPGTLEAIGIAYQDVGKLEDAILSFRKAIHADENHQGSRYHLARILVRQNLYEEAIEHFNKTDHGLSKSHQLECIYYLGDRNLFFQKYETLIENKKINPLMASLGSHAAIRYGIPDVNPFCSSPMNFIEKIKVDENDGFDQVLIDKIINYHKGNENDFKSQPLLKNGEQSSGNLFLIKLDFIQSLKKIILQKVSKYRDIYQKSDEGFIKNWPENFTLYGWLVAIKTGGHLAAHIHKEGWLSGSLYFKLPKKPNSNEGNIAFSIDGANYPKDGKEFSTQIVEIEKGDLVMFPSSLFHNTIPFNSDEERVSFAFDIIPTQT